MEKPNVGTTTCCGPHFEALEPAANINYIYRTAMVGMDQLPIRHCYAQNCCPNGVCEYCFGNFCAYRRESGDVGICMLGHSTK